MKAIFVASLLLFHFASFGQTVANSKKSIETIRRIFNEYKTNEEAMDSKENKLAMEKAFQSIKKVANAKDWELLINVWLYYDPTDFGTRKLIEPIFYNDKLPAIAAINKRLKNKMKWEESIEEGGFSDLIAFRDKLQAKN